MTKKLDFMNVPIDLCRFALERKKVNQVKLYLYLKSRSDGYIKAKDAVITQAGKDMGVCEKTLRRYLYWLFSEGWLIANIDQSGIRIISYRLLKDKIDSKCARGSLLYKSKICDFEYFATASVIQFHIRGLNWRNRKAGLLKRNPELEEVPPYPLLPLSYFAKILGKSKSSAARYMGSAKAKKYLRSKKEYIDLEIPNKQMNALRKYGKYNPNRLRRKGSQIYYQLPNRIETDILIRKKWNIRKQSNNDTNMEKNGT